MSTKYAFGPEFAIAKITSGNIAPEGTTVQILDLGSLNIDAAFLYAEANAWTRSKSVAEEREILKCGMYSILVDHPTAGLILYDAGPGIHDTWEESWGPEICDMFAPDVRYPSQALDEQIKLCGYDIAEVKHVIISHLHLDHAGGLQYFQGREDVTVWVHELELKYAFWAACTGIDSGYLPYYLDTTLNWQTFSEQEIDLFPGITLHLSPGHTAGLIWMQINLKHSGTVVFTSDHSHIRENYENGHPQGWDLGDRAAWYRSTQRLRRLQMLTNATLVFGHDPRTIEAFLKAKGKIAS